MKATCPKCGGVLRVVDWKPNCPFCGVNMVDYNMQSRLLEDADHAELEYSRIRPKLDRLKAAYIGSKKCIARLVYSAAVIGGLFLPLAKLQYTAAFAAADKTVHAISLVEIIKEHLHITSPFTVQGAPVPSSCTAAAILSLIFVLLTVLLLLVHLGCIGGSCTAKGRRRIYVTDACMLLCALGSLGAFHAFASAAQTALPQIVLRFSPGFGAYVFLALLFGILAADIIVLRSGIEVQYTPCWVGAVPAQEYEALLEAGLTGAQIRERYAAAHGE